MTRSKVRHLTLILVMLIASGCSQLATTGNSAPPATDGNQDQEITNSETDASYLHRVQRRGETLILISRWYTGSGNNWRAIARANPDLEPRRIQVGDRIRIPSHLLQTRKTMPADYRLGNQPGNPEPRDPPSPGKASEALDLFGPLDSEKEKEDGEETRMILETLDS